MSSAVTMATTILSPVLLLLLVLPYQAGSSSDPKTCARHKSRIVSSIVRKNILPVFQAQKTSLTPECPFSLKRDMYAVHEAHKVYEGSGRYTCDFCGKAFVSEYFLDRHFENRHMEHLQTDRALCLADECDVFRCDIVSGASEPDFWDIALCLEDDMDDLMAQCKALVKSCVPTGLTHNQTLKTTEAIMDSVCSFLNCRQFWNTSVQQDENTHTALSIVLTTMTCFGILIYNFVFYNYFYSEFSDGSSYDPSPKVKYKMKEYKKPYKPQRDAAVLRHPRGGRV